MVGVRGVHENATLGDWVAYQVYSPAQPSGGITENTGAGDYDKEVVVSGVLNRFKPQTNGDWDLDITSALNSNVDFTKAVVAPAAVVNHGYFDYNKNNNTITAVASGTGKYDISTGIECKTSIKECTTWKKSWKHCS